MPLCRSCAVAHDPSDLPMTQRKCRYRWSARNQAWSLRFPMRDTCPLFLWAPGARPPHWHVDPSARFEPPREVAPGDSILVRNRGVVLELWIIERRSVVESYPDLATCARRAL